MGVTLYKSQPLAMTASRHLPPTILERFHDKYGTSSLVLASPRTLSTILDSDAHLRIRFLAACLLSRREEMRSWIDHPMIDTPYVFYSVLEACCQRGTLHVSRILALQVFCVDEHEAIVFYENLCARGCLAAARWWRGCTGTSPTNSDNLVSLVAANGRWEIWTWLRTIDAQTLHNLQRLAFHSACLGGQIEFARRLWNSYQNLDPTIDSHRLHRCLWQQISYLHEHPRIVPEHPDLPELVGIVCLISQLLADQYLGPYQIASQPPGRDWKRLTKKYQRRVAEVYREHTGISLSSAVLGQLYRDTDLSFERGLDAWEAQILETGTSVRR